MNRRQTLLGWAAITAGFVAIAAAWGQVQGTHVVAVQLSYVTSGGLIGLGGAELRLPYLLSYLRLSPHEAVRIISRSVCSFQEPMFGRASTQARL